MAVVEDELVVGFLSFVDGGCNDDGGDDTGGIKGNYIMT